MAFGSPLASESYLVHGQLHPNGQLDLLVDGQRYLVYSARSSEPANRRLLWLDGQTYTVTSVDPHRRQSDQPVPHTGGMVNANMPGQVRALLVAVGDQVSTGDPLLILEAMKMETRILAPHTGKISKINCALGMWWRAANR